MLHLDETWGVKMEAGEPALAVVQAALASPEEQVNISKEIYKHSPNTGARANNTLQVTRPSHRGAC